MQAHLIPSRCTLFHLFIFPGTSGSHTKGKLPTIFKKVYFIDYSYIKCVMIVSSSWSLSACNTTKTLKYVCSSMKYCMLEEKKSLLGCLPAFTVPSARLQCSKAMTTPLLCQIVIFNVFIRIVFISLSNRRKKCN